MIYLIRKSKFVFPVVALTTLVVCIGGLSIALLLVTVLGNNHFTMYLQEDSSYTMSTLFLYILICLCTLPYLFKYYKSGYNSKVEISCVVLACAFQYWCCGANDLRSFPIRRRFRQAPCRRSKRVRREVCFCHRRRYILP